LVSGDAFPAAATTETVLLWSVAILGENDVFASHWDARCTTDESPQEI
jgi:hypothetical protein